MLHNDDKNDFDYVILTIMSLTPLNETDAELRTKEAHQTGVALLLVTHKEAGGTVSGSVRIERIIVTIEPAE